MGVLDWVGETHREFRNDLVHGVLIAVVEGWDAYNHLIYQDAHAPPVHGLIVSFACDDLRGEIFRGPAEGLSEVLITYHLSKAEVRQAEIALGE